MQENRIIFREFLTSAFDKGEYSTDDLVAFLSPLFKEVIGFHESSMVAPFEIDEALFVTDNVLDIEESRAQARKSNLSAVDSLFKDLRAKNFNIVENLVLDAEVDMGRTDLGSASIQLDSKATPSRPVYLPGVKSFEQILGHHDDLTDIFSLGMIMAAMALGLDIYSEDDLKTFVLYRNNPSAFNHRIHPTISALIIEMTELDRRNRQQNLYEVIERLENYRDFDPEKQVDLSRVAGWVNKELAGRSQFVLNKLKNRLFDTSRRNRLMYYKPNLRFVNLTIGSVPTVLHYQSIRPELLFIWNDEISSKVIGMKEIVLNKYLRFEDHLYISSALDRVRVEAQRDVQEYGFSQLKLVISFLNWHNLKEDINERIQSPLLLIPVEIKKNKKVKEDHFVLKILDNDAEVNPVLANTLRELFGIKLPDFVSLDEMSLEHFYQLLKSQIDAANQGITLRLIDKPRIKLIHSVARQTIGNYSKRLRKKEGRLESYKDINYSYDQENFKPLGLEIFRQRIEPRSSFLEFLVNEDIKISNHSLAAGADKERLLFELADSDSNPYSWDFDTCNIVLGNFNYKKMSLVRDYNTVIDNNLSHAVFEDLFSVHPKAAELDKSVPMPISEWNHVITADPTQTQAVLRSRKGESYIIQGPPGTGKSQTITNLIADFVANGKSVLFVCEKRAALDVVYYRLKQQGLHELCCYIHDSQGDKRSFIKNLKVTYDEFLSIRPDKEAITKKREMILKEINEQLSLIKEFHFTHLSSPDTAGTEVRKLLERLVELKPFIEALDPEQEQLIPHYKEWLPSATTIQELGRSLEDQGAEPVYAEHPFSRLNETLFTEEQAYLSIKQFIDSAHALLKTIESSLLQAGVDESLFNKFNTIRSLIQEACLLEPLAKSENLDLVKENAPKTKTFEKRIKALKKLQKELEVQKTKTTNWHNRLPLQEARPALELSIRCEKSLFSFLNGNWRRLKSQLNRDYDFSRHQVKPAFSSILKDLIQEYEIQQQIDSDRELMEEEYNLENIDLVYVGIERLRAKPDQETVLYVLEHPNSARVIQELFKQHSNFRELELILKKGMHDFETLSFSDLFDSLENIRLSLPGLQDMLPELRQFSQLTLTTKKALRSISLTAQAAEASMASKTWKEILHNNRSFAGTDFMLVEKAVHKIQAAYKKLLGVNAELIRAIVKTKFLYNLDLSNTALSQLNAEQKLFKKNYTEGRKILENEFGKSMRFKSIRELSTRESGLILKDLKPVWLMSPLSVSDSIPLQTDYFDVIIFDEASQITLEEGIPSLYRAPQTVIVGDEKQMPPTNFFSAKAEDPEDLEQYNLEDVDEVLSNDVDSLLTQGTRKLNSVMLGWHYRSRYETLISFSNHAFYEAGLLTIPDKTIHHQPKKTLEIELATDAQKNVEALFDRSISFHYHTKSIYEKRSNLEEANYIAELVRSLLLTGRKESIGIVAFSQEQQHTIEDALTRLASSDKVFEQLLEEAYTRTEEDQFIGLFVKNLENVQGDERDIIIVSVCYGFDSRKKMIMNFGPVNKKGGEKRLNVIFSRAKQHMAVVSSIKHSNITNEYNEGANYFKRFLHYAELISCGDMALARIILDGLILDKKGQSMAQSRFVVREQLQSHLQQLGYEVAEQVGQSNFKCSLAIKENPSDEAYSLSILIDDDYHYANENLLEQYYQRPRILESFGWKSIQIFTKDWFSEPQRVIDQILKKLKETNVPIPESEDITETIPTTIGPELSIIPELPKPSSDQNARLTLSGYEHLEFDRYEFKDGASNKFWELAIEHNKLIIRFGKIGTRGQTQVKSFENTTVANKEKDKMIREKTSKGYKSTKQ